MPLGYESAERDGNAVCAFNGTGYPLDGSSFSLPESLLSNLESLRNPAVPGLSSLSTATQGIAIPALTSPGDLPIPTVTTPPPRGTITKSKVSEPTAVNDPGCPAYMPTKTIRLSSIARSSNATPKTTVFLSSYRATAYSTETIQIVLATTKSSSPGTLRPMSVVSLAVGDSSKAGVSSSMVTSTVFGTLTHSGWSSIANAAPPYPGQGAFVALLAFAAAVF
ncbi:hypothetical protein Plec18167_005434 [Paecilomyces lecythidis]|uniref:Uncharacterized protein n=1 Tax=Paecilomyces lecythidis TaxID=3004212 RepID=A0ABR3XK99_9EURO